MHPDRRKAFHLKWAYNLSLETYNILIKTQKGLCAICRKKPTKPFNVDHSHNTNQVRGLLCWTCNLLLGHARDNITILKQAIRYLQKYE
jgi:Recombination endonuclease VII